MRVSLVVSNVWRFCVRMASLLRHYGGEPSIGFNGKGKLRNSHIVNLTSLHTVFALCFFYRNSASSFAGNLQQILDTKQSYHFSQGKFHHPVHVVCTKPAYPPTPAYKQILKFADFSQLESHALAPLFALSCFLLRPETPTIGANLLYLYREEHDISQLFVLL